MCFDKPQYWPESLGCGREKNSFAAAAPIIFLVLFGFSKPAFFCTITLEWLAQMLRHFAFVVRSLCGVAYSSPYLNVMWNEEREIVECSLKIFKKRKINFKRKNAPEEMLYSLASTGTLWRKRYLIRFIGTSSIGNNQHLHSVAATCFATRVLQRHTTTVRALPFIPGVDFIFRRVPPIRRPQCVQIFFVKMRKI